MPLASEHAASPSRSPSPPSCASSLSSSTPSSLRNARATTLNRLDKGHGRFRARRCAAPRNDDGSKSFAELAQHGANDVGIIVGPHPLLRVRLLQLPILRLGDRTEIVVAAGHRHDGAEELVFV